MADPQMAKIGYIQRIVAGEGVAINDGVRHNLFFQNRQQRRRPGIGNHRCIDLAARFNRPKIGYLPAAPRPRLP